MKGSFIKGGYYYGKIKFPREYPFKSPGISMITPNGRFMTQRRICLSVSDFHPQTWNPMWSVSSILTGLFSFMMENSPTTGSVTTMDEEKQRLAKASLAFNCKIQTFRKLFPEYAEKHEGQGQCVEQAAPASNEDENTEPLLKQQGAEEELQNVQIMMARMNESPIKRRHESADYYPSSDEFDYQEDFAQFLEEARQDSCRWSSNPAHLQAAGKKQLDGERKNRKSWKSSLFSWLKTHRESKSSASKPRSGYVSGPVERSGSSRASGRARMPASGPLIGLFSSTGRAEEFEVPYMCLGQLNKTQKLRSYGPIYLVT